MSRIVIGIASTLLLIAALTSAFIVRQVKAVDWWPMFRHDQTHTGYSTSTAPNTNHTIWNFTAGGWVRSSPAVIDDKVYVGSHDTNVYCLNAKTGTEIWNYSTANTVESSPAVADDKVYVGSNDDRFYCLNASNGAKIWSYTTGGDVYSSPAVANGIVYVGSMDGNIYAFGPPTVGGVLIHIDKLALLAPYIALAAVVVAFAAGSVYVGRHWFRKLIVPKP